MAAATNEGQFGDGQVGEGQVGKLPNLTAAKKPQPVQTLPKIREELKLLPAATNHDGSPAWMIQDPVNNRFFRIGWLDFEILSRWHYPSTQKMIASVSDETTLTIDAEDIKGLIFFLDQNNWLQADDSAKVNRLSQRANEAKSSAFNWLLHHYLFFRVPLVRPQVFLAKLLRLSAGYTRPRLPLSFAWPPC